MTSTIIPPRRRDGYAPERILPVQGRPLPGVRALAVMAAVVIAVSAIAAGAFALLTPRVYGAQAEVIFQPSGDLSVFRAERDMATQQVVLQGQAVLGPVAGTTRIPVKNLQDMVSGEIVGQTNVLRITVAHPDRGTAVALAELITTEYLKRFTSASVTAVDPAAAQLDRQVQTLSDTISKMLDRLERLARERRPDAPATPEERELRGAVTSTLHRMGVLQNQLTTLDQRRFQQPDVSLLVPAHPLEEPLRPRLLQALAVGALVGLFLTAGIALALLRPWARHVDSGWE
jgi:capsular polysaccharide biosynthesis protein